METQNSSATGLVTRSQSSSRTSPGLSTSWPQPAPTSAEESSTPGDLTELVSTAHLAPKNRPTSTPLNLRIELLELVLSRASLRILMALLIYQMARKGKILSLGIASLALIFLEKQSNKS